jgi:ferredoxin
MLAFLLNFNQLKGSDIFIGNTRAGMKLSKLFLPGLSGIAMYFPALIMMLKGYEVRAMYPVDLPSNWISLHPGVKPAVVDSMVDHYRKKVGWFGNEVFEGRRVFLRSFALLPLDALVAPIALGYYFVGRFILAKTFVANYNCNNCGLCMEQCPTQSIIMHHGRPYWKFTCESCMHCMNYCPKRAIETAHSFVFLILALFIFLLNPYFSELANELVKNWLNSSTLAFKVIYFVLRWSAMLFTFWAGYKGLHNLMRFPRVNKLISMTTLSYWKFWRRYHIPKEPVVK